MLQDMSSQVKPLSWNEW